VGLFGYKKPDLHGIDRKSPLGHLLYHFALGRDGYTKESDRHDIAHALIDMNDKRAMPVLIDMLGSKDWVIVESAAMVIGRLGDTSAIAPVREALAKWERRQPDRTAKYLRTALEQLQRVEKRRQEYAQRGPAGKADQILEEEWLPLFKKAGHRVFMAEFQYIAVSLQEFSRSGGKVKKRSEKHMDEAFDALADAVVEFKTAHNTLLEVCHEFGLDWKEVCRRDEDATDLVEAVGDYLTASSDLDVLEILTRRMDSEDPRT